MKELVKGKAERCYIMLDIKSDNLALVKVGMTQDTLKHRLAGYRTANPFLELVAICEVRCNQNVFDVEERCFQFLRQTKGYEHAFGEWVIIDNEDDILAIQSQGFRFFEKLWYRTKHHEMYNEQVRNLWAYIPR